MLQWQPIVLSFYILDQQQVSHKAGYPSPAADTSICFTPLTKLLRQPKPSH
jgi:hypothetical protein